MGKSIDVTFIDMKMVTIMTGTSKVWHRKWFDPRVDTVEYTSKVWHRKWSDLRVDTVDTLARCGYPCDPCYHCYPR